MFKQESEKDAFLEHTKAAREERANEKKREIAATKVQAVVKGWLQRLRYSRIILWVGISCLIFCTIYNVRNFYS